MKCLVVDDELAGRHNMESALLKISPQSLVKTAESVADAVELCRENNFDVAFLDIELRDGNGLDLAQKIRQMHPQINIIMVTAYDRYALEAHKLYVSGYIMKPPLEADVREALANLRFPVAEEKDEGLQIRCFGDFDVSCDGTSIRFRRTKSKELLAFLIDRRGAAVNTGRICAALWESDNGEKTKNYFRQVMTELRRTLRQFGAEDLLACSRDSFAIDPDKIDCDYYRYLAGDPDAVRAYQGEYMSQYSWAEVTAGSLARGKREHKG